MEEESQNALMHLPVGVPVKQEESKHTIHAMEPGKKSNAPTRRLDGTYCVDQTCKFVMVRDVCLLL